MKACWYEHAGSARDVLEFADMADIAPGRGELRVRMVTCAVNPTDTKRRSQGRELGRFARIIPNNDGAGVIDAVGEGVDARRIGERVWVFAAQAGRPFGTAAGYCVLPASQARPLPANQSMEVGACLGVPAVTAHRGLFADGPIDGQSILITGGSGRVGAYAVQMARHAGATVIATAGSTQKRDEVLALGAHHVVDYKKEDLCERVLQLTNGEGVHRLVDVAFGNNIAIAADLVRNNGVITAYGSDATPTPTLPFYALMFKNITLRPFSIMGMPQQAKDEAFAAIDAHLRNDTLHHRIGARFGFDEMASAHEAIEAGRVHGVCIVQISDELSTS